MFRISRPAAAGMLALAVLGVAPGGGAASTMTTSLALDATAGKDGGQYLVYVGTYTGKGSKGIYAFPFDAKTGKAGEPRLMAETESPSFVAISPNRKFLYAANEISNYEGKSAGSITAYAIGPHGELTLLNRETSGGSGPCFVTVDRTGKTVLVANYGGGSIETLPIGPDGRLGAPASFIQHHGSSVDKQRQEGPHAHSINVSPDDRYAFAADLGLDKIFIYRLDSKTSKLMPNVPAFGQVAPGSGPRHFAFHPDGRHAFVINEMASTLTAFDYNPKTGALKEIETVSTIPNPVPGNSTAEVAVHPSGKWVYGSNRGHNSIAIFSFDAGTGRLKPVGHQPTGGRTPRNFALDPSGHFLLAANQDSGSITVFRVDSSNGHLTPTGQSIAVSMPVCVRFLPVD